MKKSCQLLLVGLAVLVAACAPISTEKVAATARPAGGTAEAEHFWNANTKSAFSKGIEAVAAECGAGTEAIACLQEKLAVTWPTAAAYRPYCSQGKSAFVVASCMVEYDFWARMGQKFYPSYRISNEWANFNLPKNPTFVEWFTRASIKCDPNMNKSQDVFYACAADTAKRDLGVEKEAGCYYSQPDLENFCYWIAAFNGHVEDRLKSLPGA